MATHPDLRILAERDHDSPRLVQRTERLANRGSGLDRHDAPFRVVVDALHGRDVDDHPYLGVGDETLEAVPATGHDERRPFSHCIVYRRHDLFRRADEPDVIRAH
jgi:hypothetical protein